MFGEGPIGYIVPSHIKILDEPDWPESDPCRNPSNSIEFSGRLCSGRGYCPAVSYWKQDRKCHCDRLKRPFKQGEYSQYLGHDGIFGRAFGNWCQCDPWNCMPDWSYGKVEYTFETKDLQNGRNRKHGHLKDNSFKIYL